MLDACGPSTLSEEQGVWLDPSVREYWWASRRARRHRRRWRPCGRGLRTRTRREAARPAVVRGGAACSPASSPLWPALSVHSAASACSATSSAGPVAYPTESPAPPTALLSPPPPLGGWMSICPSSTSRASTAGRTAPRRTPAVGAGPASPRHHPVSLSHPPAPGWGPAWLAGPPRQRRNSSLCCR